MGVVGKSVLLLENWVPTWWPLCVGLLNQMKGGAFELDQLVFLRQPQAKGRVPAGGRTIIIIGRNWHLSTTVRQTNK